MRTFLNSERIFLPASLFAVIVAYFAIDRPVDIALRVGLIETFQQEALRPQLASTSPIKR